MNPEDPPPLSPDEVQAALDRATADVAAGRIVPAHAVHARLRHAITAAPPEPQGTHPRR
jgi:hypothetical protein